MSSRSSPECDSLVRSTSAGTATLDAAWSWRELYWPKVIPGDDWRVHYALLARAGFTDAARAEAEALDAILVDLITLDQDLRRALGTG